MIVFGGGTRFDHAEGQRRAELNPPGAEPLIEDLLSDESA